MSDPAEAPVAPPIIVRVEGGWGRLTLNRPKALHALTLPMCRLMIEALVAWRDDPGVVAVLLDHSGERGFCAGGDIRMLADSGAGDGAAARVFFGEEYRLNALLFDYKKPVVALIDGVVMGGGVGISAPASHRVATERTLFAMPETGIGLFPDVGGGWWLPRLPGESGLWLGLTGARIEAPDCLALGLATHVVDQARLEALKAELLADPSGIDATLARFAAAPVAPPLAEHRAALDSAFAGDSVEAIFAALEADGSAWAMAQHTTLRTKSPQALKVTFRELREGRSRASFAEEMAAEYRIATRVCALPDFHEGVRAVILDKDNAPRWTPATLEAVTPSALDAVFAPLPAGEEWTPLA